MFRLLLVFSVFPIVCSQLYGSTTYESIQEDANFEAFYDLLRHNGEAKNNLLNDEITIFIPTNEAFQRYGPILHSDLAFYHMASAARAIEDLKKTRNISCINPKFPPLWISRNGDDLYVNNAEVFSHNYYPSKSRTGEGGKPQIVYLIDRVLDPLIRLPHFKHTAFDFMGSFSKFTLGSTRKSVHSFLYKVQENNVTDLYEAQGGNTYFIPIDEGIGSKQFHAINRYSIYSHIIPNVVLFTRPTKRQFNYESLANDDFVYTVLSLEDNRKLYVRGNTILGKPSNPQGEFVVEILHPDIPVANGVVHVISRPLGVFPHSLKPFPYVSVLEKVASDPNLDTFYRLGEKFGFHSIFTAHDYFFTYFVPSEYAWRQIRKSDLQLVGSEVDLLKRHLVLSETPFSMERLLATSKTSNVTGVSLQTVGGLIKLHIHLIDGTYYIQWYNKLIRVTRPNYECSDGIVHVLAGPIATFQRNSFNFLALN
ncbi:fasciclin-1-like isoform X2 [Cylas formicarius]|uniref:fasciclin-1-like isoform X2 n=1 Tax=Cylas formicarius TaxID=197179 RepID=UPI0029588DFC|nr:fasciclin-1-like isoform X2 [Cylas formicarius]